MKVYAIFIFLSLVCGSGFSDTVLAASGGGSSSPVAQTPRERVKDLVQQLEDQTKSFHEQISGTFQAVTEFMKVIKTMTDVGARRAEVERLNALMDTIVSTNKVAGKTIQDNLMEALKDYKTPRVTKDGLLHKVTSVTKAWKDKVAHYEKQVIDKKRNLAPYL